MKLLVFIGLVMFSFGAFSQTTLEKIKATKAEYNTLVAKLEKLKMEENFKEVNVDTLTTKKSVISIAKDSTGLFTYIKVGTKNYKIDKFNMNMEINGQMYQLMESKDTIKCYSGGVILFTIQ